MLPGTYETYESTAVGWRILRLLYGLIRESLRAMRDHEQDIEGEAPSAGRLTGFVFERGVEITRTAEQRWVGGNTVEPESVDPEYIIATLGSRPVLWHAEPE